MRTFNVVFTVFETNSIGSKKASKIISVHAENQRTAVLRAMQEINALPGYSEKYKTVKSIEEVV